MKKDLTFEEMADSLILTACDERLKILNETSDGIDKAVSDFLDFNNAYSFVRRIIVEERNKIYGIHRLLFKADYICADEYFRLQSETSVKFEEIEMRFVLKFAQKYFSKEEY